MRVGILALLHESNTFVSQPTTVRQFEEHVLLEGDAIRERFAGSHHEMGGFLAGLDRAGIEAVPLFAARALPSGTIEADSFDALMARMLAAVSRAGRLDGFLVAPHGATVSERFRDADGHWLSELRRTVGPGTPIIGTLDPHANLSERMVAATDALIAYRTNPHLDQQTRGEEAAALMVRTLRREICPIQVAQFPRLAINIERQLTREPPCRALYELADAQLHRDGVLSNSILLGFPYADVEEMGSAVLVVADGQRSLADECSRQLADHLWSRRHEFRGELIDIEAALDRAQQLAGPICLLDMGDNIGGGSPGDSTFLAHAIRRRGIASAFVCLCDPDAQQRAARVGEGAQLPLSVGGKTDASHGPPFHDDFLVLGLSDGRFHEPQPRHGGFTDCDQGPTAVVRGASGLTFMLTTRRMPPFSLVQLTSCGVKPDAFQLIVAKGVNAPVAAYEPVCRHFIRVNTPGCTTADMERLPYAFRRRPLFPFELEAQWQPTDSA